MLPVPSALGRLVSRMAAKKATKANGTALEHLVQELAERQRRADERAARNEDLIAQALQIAAKADARSAKAEERMAHADERMAQIDERHSDLRRHSDELFFELSKINAQIIKRLDRIEATLEEHSRVLERLPEAIRERVGFGRPA